MREVQLTTHRAAIAGRKGDVSYNPSAPEKSVQPEELPAFELVGPTFWLALGARSLPACHSAFLRFCKLPRPPLTVKLLHGSGGADCPQHS